MQNRLLYNWQPQSQVLKFFPQMSVGAEWEDGMLLLMSTKLNFDLIYRRQKILRKNRFKLNRIF